VSDGISEASKQFTLNVSPVSPVSPVVKYFRYVMIDDPNESFIVKMTNSATIQQALDDLNGQRRLIVSGIVNSDNGGFNSPWSWHLDPATVILGESFIELCDARPSYVETHLVEWLGQRYCPWGARVNAAYDTPPTPGVRPTSTAPVTSVTIQVQVNALNVREDAALSAQKIGLVRQGETLKKIEEKNGWVKVELSSGQTGWVFGQYTAPAAVPNVSAPRQKVIVMARVLNVRSGAGINTKVITTVQRNAVLEKVEEKSGWIRIILPSGQSGWVYGKFVK
jgi:SH3-like domain-containing protein